ncbi:HD domain-containing protein [uncultured Flavonifractor sp.]|uniref:HD domain-containing protein n=1 Tax=uncultured Flavonifractor sp. TaxID=1193534 RepID=UPI00261B709A|nr:HD domain-containing protein [uncultured Flavonifractor sp.]
MREERWSAYLDCVGELLSTPQVQAMKHIRHHPGVSCFEHSLFVSYVAFCLAEKWRGDPRAAARAGLLHDLYLHDPKCMPSYKQCFAHPVAALRNARVLCGSLSREEENGILAHMWPLSSRAPRSRVAAAVCLADKLCATAEVLGLWRRSALCRTACRPAPAFGGNAVKNG